MKSVNKDGENGRSLGGGEARARGFLSPHKSMPVSGAFAPLPAAQKTAPVRLVTYNIHRCIGLDRRYDPARVAAVLREVGAGIACLQEVGLQRRGEHPGDQGRFLAEATGAKVIFANGVRDHSRRFGNAILTFFPVLAESAIDLGVAGCEPRSAIDADLLVAGRVLRVIATHFGLSQAERRLQASRLVAALAAPLPANRPPASSILVMGDLNEWRGRRAGIRALEGRLGRSITARTFPSFMPILALDRIYVDERALLEEVQVYRSPLARLASDHLPLVATLTWGAPAAANDVPIPRGIRKPRFLAAAATLLRSHQQKRRASPIGW